MQMQHAGKTQPKSISKPDSRPGSIHAFFKLRCCEDLDGSSPYWYRAKAADALVSIWANDCKSSEESHHKSPQKGVKSATGLSLSLSLSVCLQLQGRGGVSSS